MDNNKEVAIIGILSLIILGLILVLGRPHSPCGCDNVSKLSINCERDTDEYAPSNETINPSGVIKETHSKCGSDSMGSLFDCHDVLTIRTQDSEDELYVGEVYTYKSEGGGHSLIHRLIGCADNSCELLIMKGDKNFLPELVPREKITGVLIGIDYTLRDRSEVLTGGYPVVPKGYGLCSMNEELSFEKSEKNLEGD